MKRHSYAILFAIAMILGAGSALAADVNLYVKEWYPKDNDFVFVCDATDFEATSYSWFYGDGHKLLNIANGDTYHRFMSTGTFTVSCEAMNGETSAADSMTVTVNEVKYFSGGSDNGNSGNDNVQEPSAETSLSVAIAPWYPKDNEYVFECNSDGYTPNSYSINFGDGEQISNVNQDSFYHTFDAAGTYTVSCTGTDDAISETGTMQVTVAGTQPVDNTGNQTNQTNQTTQPVVATLSLADGFPIDHNYVFECEAPFTATSYTFNLGDGTVVENNEFFDVYHSYRQNGNYAVSCTATDGQQTTVSAPMPVSVSSPNPSQTFSASAVMTEQNGNTASFICDAVGFTTLGFGWKVKDSAGNDLPGFEGETWQTTMGSQPFTYTFSEPGDYSVVCKAMRMEHREDPRYYGEQWYHTTSICRGAPNGECETYFPTVNVQIS